MSVPPLTSALVLSVTSIKNCAGSGGRQLLALWWGSTSAHLGLALVHVLEDVEVDDGAEVVDVRDEEVLLALAEELVDEARVGDGVEQISVAGRVPAIAKSVLGARADRVRGAPSSFVLERRARGREERLLVDARVARLVERDELDVVVRVLLDDASSVLIRVERVHEDERDVHLVRRVEML